MKSTKNAGNLLFSGLILFSFIAPGASTFAKVRPISPVKAKPIEANTIKGVTGEASLVSQQAIQLPASGTFLQFQDGKLADTIEFYKSPRCYLHFRKGAQEAKQLPAGQVLQVNKIDNIYVNGSVHVTFWFDKDPAISDLACITNYNHTLTAAELKATLGNFFQVSLTKSVESDALFNTVPDKNIKVLSEDSYSNSPTYSARIILTDS